MAMAGKIAELPKGTRITDYISLGVIAEKIPLSKVQEVLAATGRGSIRERDLPAHVMVYYVVALALYMQSAYTEVLRCLFEGLAWLFGTDRTRGSRYRGWRLVSLDGTTLDVADTASNAAAFGYPSGRLGDGSYPQLRLVSLVESGTHVLFRASFGGFRTGETVLARDSLCGLKAGMVCVGDRNFFGYELWRGGGGGRGGFAWGGGEKNGAG